MLVQQSFAFMATLVLPVAAPAISEDLHISPALIGGYSFFLYSIAFISALSCGGFIIRFGPLRMSQVSLLLMTAGLLTAAAGNLIGFAIGAMLIGFGSAISTPASSEILARYSPLRYAPLIFSIKQTGVPAGGILAGMLVPWLIRIDGWQLAFWTAGAMCLILAFTLQPLRSDFDSNRELNHRVSLHQIRQNLRGVYRYKDRREMALMCFTYVGVQSIFGIFFVIYLVDSLDYELMLAGNIFAGAQIVSIIARVFWGWMASRFVSPRLTLALFGVAMSISCLACGLLTNEWNLIAVVGIAIAYAATAISFHGVMMAEIARISPQGEVGLVTGGILAFASLGMLTYPTLFGILLAVTDSYGLGFVGASIPALIVGLMLLTPRKRDS